MRDLGHLGNEASTVRQTDTFGKLEEALDRCRLVFGIQRAEGARELASAASDRGPTGPVIPVRRRVQRSPPRKRHRGTEEVRDQ